MSSETRCGDDVTWHMAEKHSHTCLNLFWRESFRVEVQRDDKRCVRIPVGEVERRVSAWRTCSSLAAGPERDAVMVEVMPAGNRLPSSIRARSPANSVKRASTFLRTVSCASSDMAFLPAATVISDWSQLLKTVDGASSQSVVCR